MKFYGGTLGSPYLETGPSRARPNWEALWSGDTNILKIFEHANSQSLPTSISLPPVDSHRSFSQEYTVIQTLPSQTINPRPDAWQPPREALIALSSLISLSSPALVVSAHSLQIGMEMVDQLESCTWQISTSKLGLNKPVLSFKNLRDGSSKVSQGATRFLSTRVLCLEVVTDRVYLRLTQIQRSWNEPSKPHLAGGLTC